MRKRKELTANHYRSLMTSLQFVKNRMIFFILFCVYALLNVLATTDKNIYMLDSVKMPLLNIELPLISFYIVIPLFLLALQFNLLYMMHSHRELLQNAHKNSARELKNFPKGLYEGALLHSNNAFLYKIVKLFLYLIVFYSPIAVLIAFYLRFGDYQNFALSSWHLILLILSVAVISLFADVFEFEGERRAVSIILKYLSIAFLISIISGLALYHYKILHRIDKSDFTKKDIKFFKKFHSELKETGLGIEELLYPRLVIENEVLIPYDKELLTLLSNLKESNDTKLLMSNIPFKQSHRNFRLAKFGHSIMIKTDFKGGHFEGANLWYAELQGSNFKDANLTSADLYHAELQGAYLWCAELQGAYLEDANLTSANLYHAELQGADLFEANLQGADLETAKLQGVSLINANLQGANLCGANLQYAYLYHAELQRAHLIYAKLQGAHLEIVKLQYADLSDANLTSADLSDAKLQDANLSEADLQGAHLRNADLQGVHLSGAKLQRAHLRNAKLQGADLYKANLQGAYLKYAELQGVNLSFAKLQRAFLRYAKLQRVLGGCKATRCQFELCRATACRFEVCKATACRFV